MDITAIEKELRALLSLTARWTEQGYTPNIEKDIALSRIRSLYDTMLSIQPKIAENQQQNNQTDPIGDDVEINTEVQENIEQKVEAEEEVVIAVEEMVEEAEVEAEEEEEEAEEEEEVEEEEEAKIEAARDFHKDFENEREKRFIHDLFCNDEGFYHQEIGKMNQLDNLDDVLIYIGQKYAWSPDNMSAQQFVELQAKRFGL